MPARARMMPISHGTACSAVVGLRRLPSRFGSQVSDGPESGGPPKAVVAAAVSRATWSPGSCSASNSGSGSGSGTDPAPVRGRLGSGPIDPRLAERRWRPRPSPFDRARAREPIPAPVRGRLGSAPIDPRLTERRWRPRPSQFDRAPARARPRARPLAPVPRARPLAPARARPLAPARAPVRPRRGSAGSASAGCSPSGGLLRGRLLRLRQGVGPRGLALERGFDRRRLVRRRRAARWEGPGIVLGRGGGRREGIRLRRLGIEGLGVRPLPLQGFDGWLVRWQRLEGIGVVGPARSWLWCPVLLQVALGPVRAVFRRSGVAHAAPPAGRLIRRMIASRPATGHSVGPRDANGSSARIAVGDQAARRPSRPGSADTPSEYNSAAAVTSAGPDTQLA